MPRLTYIVTNIAERNCTSLVENVELARSLFFEVNAER